MRLSNSFIRQWWSRLLRWFDRLFARGSILQAVSLISLVLVFVVLLTCLSYFLFRQQASFGQHLRKIVYLFIYPDSFGEVKKQPQGLWFYTFTLVSGTVIVGGLLISVLTNMLQNRVRRVRGGYVAYRHMSDHILVIGYDEIVPHLVARICAQHPGRDVLVQSVVPAQQVRNAVFAATPDGDEKHIFIYIGRRDSRDDLSRLRPWKAREIFVIGDRHSDDHDALNMECIRILSKLLMQPENRPKHRIPMNVLFEDRATTIAFQTTDVAREIQRYLNLYPLNFYENWSRRALAGELIGTHSLVQLDRGDDSERNGLDGPPGIVRGSKRRAQLVVVGMSRMGITLGIQAAHIMHYPNFSPGNGLASKVTFIDLNADTEMRRFMCLHQPFFDVQDTYYTDLTESGDHRRQTIAARRFTGEDANFVGVHFEFVKGDIYSDAVRGLLSDLASDTNLSLTVAICLNHSRQNASAAMSLPQNLYDTERRIPILVQQRTSGAIFDTLAADQDNRFCNVFPFGMLECGYDLDHNLERMAMQMYNTYRQAQINQLGQLSESIEQLWNEGSILRKWSSIHAVTYFPTKLRSLGLQKTGKPISLTPESRADACEIEHRRWCAERLLLGVSRQTEGEPKAPFRHRCLAPYDQVKQLPQPCNEEGVGQYELNDLATLQAIPMMLEVINSTRSQTAKNSKQV